MRVAICDDEKAPIEYLSSLLKEIDGIEIVGTFTKQKDLLHVISCGEEIEIVFMDIDWKDDTDGIQLSKRLFEESPNTQIIYVTGYNDRFSQHIFLEDSNLCGYLVKPVQKELLEAMLKRAENRIKRPQDKLVIHQRGQVYAIPFDELLYLESRGHNMIVYTTEDQISIYGRLETYKESLSRGFQQCHKSYVVNMDHIVFVDQNTIWLKNNMKVPISKSKYKEFRENYFKYMSRKM